MWHGSYPPYIILININGWERSHQMSAGVTGDMCVMYVKYSVVTNTEVITNKENVCTRVTNCFSAHERAQKQFVTRAHTLFISHTAKRIHKNTDRHTARTIVSWPIPKQWVIVNEDKNDDFYTSSPCLNRSVFVLLMTSQLISDDVTITRQL